MALAKTQNIVTGSVAELLVTADTVGLVQPEGGFDDPLKALGCTANVKTDPVELYRNLLGEFSELGLRNFSEQATLQQQEKILLMIQRVLAGADNELSKRDIQQAIAVQLAFNFDQLINQQDRLGEGSVIDHILRMTDGKLATGANPILAQNRNRLAAHFVVEMAQTVQQGRTVFCVGISKLESELKKNPAELARQLAEGITTGTITMPQKDQHGDRIKLICGAEAFEDGIRKGASLAITTLAIARFKYTGITDSGATREQNERFCELSGDPYVLKAVGGSSAAHELSEDVRISRALPIIAQRMADVDASGRMKEFFASVIWNPPGQQHAYHNLYFQSYDAASDSFLAYNPWDAKDGIPAWARQLGIRQADGETGEQGGLIVPRMALATMANYVCYQSGNEADLGISPDAVQQDGADPTLEVGIDFNKLHKSLKVQLGSNDRDSGEESNATASAQGKSLAEQAECIELKLELTTRQREEAAQALMREESTRFHKRQRNIYT